jgi:hypothetical protein
MGSHAKSHRKTFFLSVNSPAGNSLIFSSNPVDEQAKGETPMRYRTGRSSPCLVVLFGTYALMLPAVLSAALFLAPSAVALDDPRLDQENPVIDGFFLAYSHTEPLADVNLQAVAQVITVGRSGSLTEIQVPIECGGGCVNITVQVQTTVLGKKKEPTDPDYYVPSGFVLAATTRTHLEMPPSMFGGLGDLFPDNPVVTWASIPLPTPATVSAGQKLAIVLRTSIPPLRGTPGSCSIWPGYAEYDGGDAWKLNASGLWIPAPEYGWSDLYNDLPFRTFVEGSPHPDAAQTKIDPKAGAFAIGASSQQVLAQVITPLHSGTLASISVPVACEAGSNLTVEVQGVERRVGSDNVTITSWWTPNNVVISSESVEMSLLKRYPPGQGPTLREIPLRIPVSVVAGEPYAIVLRNVGECGWFPGPTGNPYDGGDGFYWVPPNPDEPTWWWGWETISNGYGRWDLPFATTVRY